VRALGVEPAATFPSYVDADAFSYAPYAAPDLARAVFVGVLERYEGVRLARRGVAGRRAARPRCNPASSATARCAIARALVAELPEQTEWSERLTAEEVAEAMDEAWLVCLPSPARGPAPRRPRGRVPRPATIVGGERAVNTAVLATFALLLATFVGIPLGIYTGTQTGLMRSLVRGISALRPGVRARNGVSPRTNTRRRCERSWIQFSRANLPSCASRSSSC
jgi:hypothetical protein